MEEPANPPEEVDAAAAEALAHARARAEPAERAAKKAAKLPDAHYMEMDLDAWYVKKDVEWPTDAVEFDLEGVVGQTRPLDGAMVQEKKLELELNPPAKIMETVLWESQAGGPYIALSAQHRIRALQQMKAQRAGHIQLPKWLTTVSASILKVDTPLMVRRFVAGKIQGMEQSVTAVKLGRCAEVFLDVLKEYPNASPTEQISTMVVLTGQKRLEKEVSLSHPK